MQHNKRNCKYYRFTQFGQSCLYLQYICIYILMNQKTFGTTLIHIVNIHTFVMSITRLMQLLFLFGLAPIHELLQHRFKIGVIQRVISTIVQRKSVACIDMNFLASSSYIRANPYGDNSIDSLLLSMALSMAKREMETYKLLWQICMKLHRHLFYGFVQWAFTIS